jgi:retron-type reverse transcriptase
MERTANIRNAYRILMEKTAGKRPLGRPIHRWVSNIKIYVKDIRWERRAIRLGYGNVPSYCELGKEAAGFMKCEESLNYPINC